LQILNDKQEVASIAMVRKGIVAAADFVPWMLKDDPRRVNLSSWFDHHAHQHTFCHADLSTMGTWLIPHQR